MQVFEWILSVLPLTAKQSNADLNPQFFYALFELAGWDRSGGDGFCPKRTSDVAGLIEWMRKDVVSAKERF